MTTTMWRKTQCSVCKYEQTTILSYYLDRKMWEKNHDLKACKVIKGKN